MAAARLHPQRLPMGNPTTLCAVLHSGPVTSQCASNSAPKTLPAQCPCDRVCSNKQETRHARLTTEAKKRSTHAHASWEPHAQGRMRGQPPHLQLRAQLLGRCVQGSHRRLCCAQLFLHLK